jgi:fucose 4-O-acetylase-like acetyltransferase
MLYRTRIGNVIFEKLTYNTLYIYIFHNICTKQGKKPVIYRGITDITYQDINYRKYVINTKAAFVSKLQVIGRGNLS